jgi:hypothetical protein
MDYYNEIAAAAFADELEKIAQATMEKQAGLGSFVMRGIKGWQGAAAKASKAAQGLKGGRTWGSHLDVMKKLYTRGAKQGGGWWGGVKGVAKSPYGAMAGTAGLGGLAAYGGYRAATAPFRGGSRQPRQGY